MKHRLINALVGYVAMFLVVLVTYASALLLAPTSLWASYEKIVVADASVGDGLLEFRSIRYVNFRSNLGGTDVLWCDLNGDGEFGHYSSQVWRGDGTDPVDGPAPTAPWPYRGGKPLPAAGTECYLRAVVTLRLPFGITRQLQPAYSDPFIVQP